MVTMRTVSPYFSPKSAMAPFDRASARGTYAVETGRLATTASLTRRSIFRRSSRDTGAKCGEVEAQPVGRDERTPLLDVRAEFGAQRGVQEVGRRVISLRAGAGAGGDRRRDRRAGGEPLGRTLDAADVERVLASPLRFLDDEPDAIALEDAPVPDLAAGFAVERRLPRTTAVRPSGSELTAMTCADIRVVS